MLHCSNASSIEKSRRYLVIKGGLAWLLWQERGVVNTVVVLGRSGVGLGVQREKRGRNNKYNANRCITMHDKTSNGARGALRWYQVIPVKGDNIRKVSSVFRVFGQTNQRGKVACSLCQGCVADKRAAYSNSSRRSEQLSCIKYYHPNYGLKDMIF